MNFAECEKELGVDWNEVTITRRVFKDGSSEYLLNKTPCRLKDIHNLFMDTGIGRSAYSIMEQGKIDQILSSRPEDRRAIFEEAALDHTIQEPAQRGVAQVGGHGGQPDPLG
jgi:chromosome segregation protein